MKPPRSRTKDELLEELELKEEKLKLLEQRAELRRELPHLHGLKHYTWSREFYESRNKQNFLCAANQIGKSTVQIRKCIHWATAIDLWPELWERRPVQFWYLYPARDVTKIEFETKWKPLLPSGQYKNHPIYGWRDEWQQKALFAIHFNSGVHVYFKTYKQDTQLLQTGTCDAIFCDEELPEEHYDELVVRLSASEGYFHMVFTATLGQEIWRKTMEPSRKAEEKFPEAYKRQVSMYECMEYEDGTPGPWTKEKIQRVKNRCKSHAEVLRRVYGRFVLDKGVKYGAFNLKRHVKPGGPVPPDWYYFVGVDPGSGGEKNHPAAICIVAVDPTYQKGRVVSGWRGDGQQTTAGDAVKKFLELRGKRQFVGMYYDFACRDFFEISTGMGLPFQPADKSHQKGEQVINVLFRNDMMMVDEDEELDKLCSELVSIKIETPKNKAKDDFADAFRYAVTRIPWDWSVIGSEILPDELQTPKKEPTRGEEQEKLRRQGGRVPERPPEWDVETEIDEWNEAYGA